MSTLETKNIRLRAELYKRFNQQGIIGSSIALQRVFTLLEKVIGTTTTVSILGETGTGKELIAKVIHYNGILEDKPFVAENCACLSDSLLESEMFGHVKGSFTGAVCDKRGLYLIWLKEVLYFLMRLPICRLRCRVSYCGCSRNVIQPADACFPPGKTYDCRCPDPDRRQSLTRRSYP